MRHVLTPEKSVYYVGDDRDSTLQRASLAKEIARLLPGFERVDYPDWEALLDRWWTSAPSGSVLAIDELPALVARSPELPSLLQKLLDHFTDRGVHLVVSGSSQSMMQGLVLDRSAPLFGRAREILRISPLDAGWIRPSLDLDDACTAMEAYAVWGGTPRYWELALDHEDLWTAIRELVLSPLGVLYEEPTRLLLDDMRDITQSASILQLIGRGCHRPSEIASRLGKPTSSLSRPLQRLLELQLIVREVPFGESTKSGKKSLYKIADPFLRFWFRFVDTDRSRLEARMIDAVEQEIRRDFSHHVGQVWEEQARESVAREEMFGTRWGIANRWWGPGLHRKPMEIDVVAESLDGERLLIGEAKWTPVNRPERLLEELKKKIKLLPIAEGKSVEPVLFLKEGRLRDDGIERVLTPGDVLDRLV